MRKLLERNGDLTGLVDLGLALRAFAQVRTQRRDAEANLAVDQQIDFVWEQMTMFHTITSEAPYGAPPTPVSAMFRALR